MKSINYEDYLIESLKDPEEAAGYLNAALEGGDINVFLYALRNVVKAYGGVKKIAETTHKGRSSLYKTLSEKGNPYLKSTNDILLAMGLHIQIVADTKCADIWKTLISSDT